VRHLSDNEIQDYLDGNPVENREEIRLHLEICEHCRARMEQYETLVSELGTDDIPELAPDFAASVVDAVEPVETEKSYSRIFAWLSAAAAFIFGVVVSIHFMSPSTLQSITKTLTPKNIPEPSFVSKYKEFLACLNLDFTMIVGVGLVLVLIALVDQLVRRRQKPVSFLF